MLRRRAGPSRVSGEGKRSDKGPENHNLHLIVSPFTSLPQVTTSQALPPPVLLRHGRARKAAQVSGDGMRYFSRSSHDPRVFLRCMGKSRQRIEPAYCRSQATPFLLQGFLVAGRRENRKLSMNACQEYICSFLPQISLFLFLTLQSSVCNF